MNDGAFCLPGSFVSMLWLLTCFCAFDSVLWLPGVLLLLLLNVDDTDENEEEDVDTPRELESDLGPYWALSQSAQAYVLNTIASYSNIEASKSTPQYGFNRGLKEFGSLGYEATVKELDDNLLGMGAVNMLAPSDVNKKIRFEALNYLVSLKRKRCGKVKARGGGGVPPAGLKENTFQKMNPVPHTRS
jgi:hypothetical protein